MNRTENRLSTESIGVLMREYAIPCVISLLVGALYNIVDQIFIANASYLGSYGNAANTVVFPLTVVALSLAVMIGDGCCAYVSIALGQQRADKAGRSTGNAITLSLCVGFGLMALYLLLQDQLITLFGGTVNEQTYAFAREYFFYITLGIPFYVFGQAMNPVIRAGGSPRFAMAATLSGAILNLILDPVFIYGLHLGMMGAAVATVIGQVVTAVLSVWELPRLKSIKPSSREDFRLDGNLDRRMLLLGVTSFLSQISVVASMAAVNNMIRKYGALDPIFSQAAYAQIPMAVIGIVMKFFQIIISVVVGLAAGCIPLVGYNIGAGRKDRVKEIFRTLLISETLVGAIGFVLAEFFPDKLIAIFGAAQESSYYTSFAVHAFRTYLFLIIPACINKACFIFLQAMGKARQSNILSLIREVVFGVGFALLLPQFFGLDGILYSMPVSDGLTFLICLRLIQQTWSELSLQGEIRTA